MQQKAFVKGTQIMNFIMLMPEIPKRSSFLYKILKSSLVAFILVSKVHVLRFFEYLVKQLNFGKKIFCCKML